VFSSPSNLEILSASHNFAKGGYCSISIEELKTFKSIIDDTQIKEDIRERIRGIFIEEN
jgi:hypothetical protein